MKGEQDMTARQYAEKVGVELVGKLKKKTYEYKEFDYNKGKDVIKKETYWIDEAGNQLMKNKDNTWCLVTPNDVIY